MYSGAPRNAELYLLLEKEINLLNGIERKRAVVRQYLREQQIEKDLDEMGMPIKWIGYRGNLLISFAHLPWFIIIFLVRFVDQRYGLWNGFVAHTAHSAPDNFVSPFENAYGQRRTH